MSYPEYVATLNGSARRAFAPIQKITVLVCEQKPYPVWFSCLPNVIRYRVKIA